MPPEMLTLLADECSSRVPGYGARARKDLLRALLTLQRRNDTRPARPLSMNRPAILTPGRGPLGELRGENRAQELRPCGTSRISVSGCAGRRGRRGSLRGQQKVF